MKQLKTKTNDRKLFAVEIVVYAVATVAVIYLPYQIYKVITFDDITLVGKIFFVFCLCVAFSLFFSLIFGTVVGLLKGKREILKEAIYIKKTNPYIYYRELPNDFGIGVASLLFDSEIENDKDIVAVILDLCAKKYIRLTKQENKYCLKILKDADEHLLKNETYILNAIISGTIADISYREWYQYCLEDGTDLNLYYYDDQALREEGKRIVHADMANSCSRLEKSKKLQRNISFITAIVVLVSVVLFGSFVVGILVALFIGIFAALIVFFIAYMVLAVVFYVINVFSFSFDLGRMSTQSMHAMVLDTQLTRTQKGVEELYKLMSFKNFLSDFGHFVDKRVDEVVLWDRYLSYAQVFGLTKEIMHSGYEELVNNASFQIDDINHINLSDIEVEQNQ